MLESCEESIALSVGNFTVHMKQSRIFMQDVVGNVRQTADF